MDNFDIRNHSFEKLDPEYWRAIIQENSKPNVHFVSFCTTNYRKTLERICQESESVSGNGRFFRSSTIYTE